MSTSNKEEETVSPSLAQNDNSNINIDENDENDNDENDNDNNDNSVDNSQTPSSSTSKLFSAGFSKTKSFFASTTSSIKSASEKAPSILSSTTSSIKSVSSSVSSSISEKAPVILASTTSTIKSVSEKASANLASVSEKAPSIIANTTSTINDQVKKTTAQLQEINKNVTSTVQDHNVSFSSVSASVKSVVPSTVVSASESVSKNIHIPSVQDVEEIANNAAANTMQSISSFLPNRRYAVPDRAVASQVLMYRQILHTECKPGLRLSRGYEGTEAQRKVKHMPWWEQGVETSKRMVISYNNLIVRLWLNGAIMPYVDGGYASEHIHITAPKDEEDVNAKKEFEEVKNDDDKDGKGDENVNENVDINLDYNASASASASDGKDEEKSESKKESEPNSCHINTLIDSKGLPPIPHPYWVDRLGFQQTDPVTDFRSGGVLSLAMLVHIVEACPNVHARFLPSGDTHMLPFGITCINITDMLAKFCMFSKAVESMDALLSQKPFWKMFGDPNSLLVLQELSMEILCNVVVEMGRERKMPKVKDEKVDDSFTGQDETIEVTVFDFAEILTTTEKRVKDDLLGSGPKTVDDLRAIHSRNYTKYIRALERKEQQAKKQYDRAMSKNRSAGLPTTTTSPTTDDEFTASIEEVKKATLGVTESVMGTAGGVFNKFKKLSFRSSSKSDVKKPVDDHSNGVDTCTEEVDFAKPKTTSSEVADMIEIKENARTTNDLFDMSDAPAPPVIEKTAELSVDDIFDFDNFTIDDDDFL